MPAKLINSRKTKKKLNRVSKTSKTFKWVTATLKADPVRRSRNFKMVKTGLPAICKGSLFLKASAVARKGSKRLV